MIKPKPVWLVILWIMTSALLIFSSCHATNPAGIATPVVTTGLPAPGETSVSLQPAMVRDSIEGLPHQVINPVDGGVMILIPPGEFIMGSEPSHPDAGANEIPPRRVYLGAYYIYKTEVTNQMFHQFARATGHSSVRWDPAWALEYPRHPATYITYPEAEAYCRWAGVTLPTEAQWEKAARGTDGREYPWGNQWNPNWCNNVQTDDPQLLSMMAPIISGRGTLPVGSVQEDRSPYGIMDMGGNINEWCLDYYSEDYYHRGNVNNPSGPESGMERVIRGGSWSLPARRSRCASRWSGDVSSPLGEYGFRCVAGPDFIANMKKNSPGDTPVKE